MAYVPPQLLIDQQQDDRFRKATQMFAEGAGGLGQARLDAIKLEKDKAEAATKEKQVKAEAYRKDGAGSSAIKKFMEGDDSEVTNFYSKKYSDKVETDRTAAGQKGRLIDSQIQENTAQANKIAQPVVSEPKFSPAEQAVDKSFGKTYEDFIVGGGYTKVDRGLKALNEVSSKLGSYDANQKFTPGKENLTGNILGRLPDFLAPNKAIEARDQVGTIIQDNLKAILGPAYTEKEGERVIQRAYDPKLSEEANKKKLDALIGQMSAAAKAKIEAAKYFEQNGSMRGYRGTQVNSVDDIFQYGEQPVQQPAQVPQLEQIRKMSREEKIRMLNGQ